MHSSSNEWISWWVSLNNFDWYLSWYFLLMGHVLKLFQLWLVSVDVEITDWKILHKISLSTSYCQSTLNGFHWYRVCREESPVFTKHSTNSSLGSVHGASCCTECPHYTCSRSCYSLGFWLDHMAAIELDNLKFIKTQYYWSITRSYEMVTLRSFWTCSNQV